MPPLRAKSRICRGDLGNGRSAQWPAPASAVLRNARQASRAGAQERAVLLSGCAMARKMADGAIMISMMGPRSAKSSAGGSAA
jgi:hypothetical protein